jgi:hypothetical protein
VLSSTTVLLHARIAGQTLGTCPLEAQRSAAQRSAANPTLTSPPLLPPAAGLFNRLREQRLCFRTFSSGGGSGGAGGSGGSGGGGGGGSSGGGGGAFGGLWAGYLSLLEKQPVATKSITAALLNGVGDAIAQTQFEDGPFDWKRFGIFTFLVSLRSTSQPTAELAADWTCSTAGAGQGRIGCGALPAASPKGRSWHWGCQLACCPAS